MTKVQTVQKIVQLLENEEKFVVLPLVEYESLKATLEEAVDPGASKALLESGEDERLGRVASFEKVFGEPLYAQENRVYRPRRKRSKKS